MNKLLILIPNFGTHQKHFLSKSIESFMSMKKIQPAFKIFSTDDNKWNLECIQEYIYDKQIGHDLSYAPYEYLMNGLYDADYIMYTENDLLFTETNILTVINENEKLKHLNMCSGFIRYEVRDNEKYLVDANNMFTPSIMDINNEKYIVNVGASVITANVHSGCWLLGKDQIEDMKPNFSKIKRTLEDRASNIYKGPWPGSDFGLFKAINTRIFNDVLIHHMPDKYCHIYTGQQPSVKSYSNICSKYNVTMTSKDYFNKHCSDKSDVNEHLPMLYALASRCNHVTEFGVRYVVSTWAFLAAKPKRLVSYDIYKDKNVSLVERCAKSEGLNFDFYQADTRKVNIEQTDLLFIDTLHTYNQLTLELNIHHSFVNKYIALHDTTTYGNQDEPDSFHLEKIETKDKHGLKAAISDFIEIHSEWKVKYVTDKNNGLTILEKHEDSF